MSISLSDDDKARVLEILRSAPDCGDNSCSFRYKEPGKLSGMRTNGGCRCMQNNSREVRLFAARVKQFLEGLVTP